MIISTDHRAYRKLLKTGSVLKGLRRDKGGGKGMIAGGATLLVFAILLMLLYFIDHTSGWVWFGGIMAALGLLFVIPGIFLKRKRDNSYLSYYQEATGFTETELLQIDRELAAPNVRIVAAVPEGGINEKRIACFLTPHYFVMNGLNPYVRRLDDIIAAAYSDSQPIWFMICLSKQDTEPVPLTLQTASHKKAALCDEILQELHARNPKILCGQEIVCDGKVYILERDSAQILRFAQENRKMEQRS